MGRHDLTNAQWAKLEPLLPAGKKSGRPPVHTKRQLIDGIRWRTRAGAPWRDVPEWYGPWGTVYGLFRRWQRDGTWHRIFEQLQARADADGLITWDVSVDSTIARAHQHAAGARRRGAVQKESPGGVSAEPEDHGLGRSRGGFTTMIHLACEQGQKPLSLLITAGQRGDSPQFEPVLNAIGVPRPGVGRPRSRPLRVRGDKAYSSLANRAYLRRRGIRCTIPEPVDQVRRRRGRGGGRPPSLELRRQRTAVQRMRTEGSRMGLLSDFVTERLKSLPEGSLRQTDLDSLLVTERIFGPLGAAVQATRFIVLATHPTLREDSDRIDDAEEALDDSVAVDDPRVAQVAAERHAFECALHAVTEESGLDKDDDALFDAWDTLHPEDGENEADLSSGRREADSMSAFEAIGKMPYDFSPARLRCMELAIELSAQDSPVT